MEAYLIACIALAVFTVLAVIVKVLSVIFNLHFFRKRLNIRGKMERARRLRSVWDQSQVIIMAAAGVVILTVFGLVGRHFRSGSVYVALLVSGSVVFFAYSYAWYRFLRRLARERRRRVIIRGAKVRKYREAARQVLLDEWRRLGVEVSEDGIGDMADDMAYRLGAMEVNEDDF